jgi:hypothetical protein
MGLWVSSRVYLDRIERRSGLYDTVHPTSRFRFPAMPSELLSTAGTMSQEAKQYIISENMLRIIRGKDTFSLGKNKRSHQ